MGTTITQRRAPDPGRGEFAIGAGIGVAGAFALAVVLLPVRDHLPSADIALVLVLPVLLAAVVGGRWAGAVSAAVASLIFDFLYTQPYLSLRIENKDDVVTFLLLLAVALLAAEIGIRARRRSASARDVRAYLHHLERVVETGASDVDADQIVETARAEMLDLFALDDCVYERDAPESGRPRIGSRGALENVRLVASGEFVLPAGGVDVRVRAGGVDYGRLVLYTKEPIAASLEQRRVAVALADELGLALASRRD